MKTVLAQPQTKAVDAAAAFANLYRRWIGDASGLSRASMRDVRKLAGLHVEDVLSIWDERAGRWLTDAPTLLRLETCDVAAFAMRSPLIAVYCGRIETESPVATFGPSNRPPRTLRAPQPFFWKSMHPCSYARGRTIEDFAFKTDGRKRLLALEAHLDDGGWLRMSSFGIDCTPAYSCASRIARK